MKDSPVEDSRIFSKQHDAFSLSDYAYTNYPDIDLSIITPEDIDERELLNLKGDMQSWRCEVFDEVVYLHERLGETSNLLNKDPKSSKPGAFFDDVTPRLTFKRRDFGVGCANVVSLPTPPSYHGDGYWISVSGPEKTLSDRYREDKEQNRKRRSEGDQKIFQDVVAFDRFLKNGIDDFLTDIAKGLLIHYADPNPSNTLFSDDFHYCFIDIETIPTRPPPLRRVAELFSKIGIPTVFAVTVLRRARDLANAVLDLEYNALDTYGKLIYEQTEQHKWFFSLDVPTELPISDEESEAVIAHDAWTPVETLFEEDKVTLR